MKGSEFIHVAENLKYNEQAKTERIDQLDKMVEQLDQNIDDLQKEIDLLEAEIDAYEYVDEDGDWVRDWAGRDRLASLRGNLFNLSFQRGSAMSERSAEKAALEIIKQDEENTKNEATARAETKMENLEKLSFAADYDRVGEDIRLSMENSANDYNRAIEILGGKKVASRSASGYYSGTQYQRKKKTTSSGSNQNAQGSSNLMGDDASKQSETVSNYDGEKENTVGNKSNGKTESSPVREKNQNHSSKTEVQKAGHTEETQKTSEKKSFLAELKEQARSMMETVMHKMNNSESDGDTTDAQEGTSDDVATENDLAIGDSFGSYAVQDENLEHLADEEAFTLKGLSSLVNDNLEIMRQQNEREELEGEDINEYYEEVRDKRIDNELVYRNNESDSISKEMKDLIEYMSSKNYHRLDYHIYSQDPEWQRLHAAVYPEFHGIISTEKTRASVHKPMLEVETMKNWNVGRLSPEQNQKMLSFQQDQIRHMFGKYLVYNDKKNSVKICNAKESKRIYEKYGNGKRYFDGICGFYIPKKRMTIINTGMHYNMMELNATVLHELFHSMTKDGMYNISGINSIYEGMHIATGLDEGITEALAREVCQKEGVTYVETKAYEFEVRCANRLREVFGDDIVLKAYFESKPDLLREAYEKEFVQKRVTVQNGEEVGWFELMLRTITKHDQEGFDNLIERYLTEKEGNELVV